MKNLILLQERRESIFRASVALPHSNKNDLFYACDLSHYNNLSEGDYYSSHEHHQDEDTQLTLYILLPTGQLLFVNSKTDEVNCLDLNEDGEEDTTWFQATYMEDLEIICCLSHSGKIVTVLPTNNNKNDKPKIVGVFEQGILNASWSPDFELLIILTTSQKISNNEDVVLVAMNTNFDIVAEVTLSGDDSTDVTASTSICWKPPYGHLFALSSVDSSSLERKIRIYKREDLSYQNVGLSEDGSGRAVPNITSCPISWAGSGCSYLLSAIQQTTSTSVPKVIFFESNGLRHKEFSLPKHNTDNQHQSTVTQLVWNIESDLLAVSSFHSCETSSTSRVQLYHRSNYHWYLKYEFLYVAKKVTQMKFDTLQPYRLLVSLSSSEHQLIEVRGYDFCWDTNVSSSLTTAVVLDGSSLLLTPFEKAIVPPPMCAYKIVFSSPVVHVAFNPLSQQQTSVHMVTQFSNGSLCLIGTEKNDRSISNEHNTKSDSFIANYSGPQLLALITVQDKSNNSNDYDATRLRQTLIVGEKNDVLYLLSVECSTTNTGSECLVVLQIDIGAITTQHILLEECSLDSKSSAKLTLVAWIVNRIPLEEEHSLQCTRVLRLVNWTNTFQQPTASTEEGICGKVLVQLTDGSLIECYNWMDDNDFRTRLDYSSCEPMMEPCPWISVLSLPTDETEIKRKSLVVGLSRRRRLYCGEQLLSSSASSFTLAHDFVIYVSLGSRAQLHFIPIPSLAMWDPLSGSEEQISLLEGYEPRQVERGSFVVAVPSKIPNVILQLPRGNLEVVVPRALTLPFSFNLIHQKKYGQALDMMRRNKIDLNLLVDLNPLAFLEDISIFLEVFCDKKNSIDHLNLFLSMLINGDIITHKYQVPEWFHFQRSPSLDHNSSQKPNQNFDFSCKVNTVCQRMRRVMLDLEEESSMKGTQPGRFLLPILSSFAKETPPQLESALELIRDSALIDATKHNNKSANKSSPFLSENAQHSIQYLAFLADYELLFHTALGMYDYDLAKAVARNSQLDPKVYLPLLKRLSNLPDKAMARYEVDMKLGRYECALRNLAEVQNDGPEQEKVHFDQCLGLIEQYQLHKLGLQLFVSNKSMYRNILISLGKRLFKEQKFSAALSAFLAVEPKDIPGAKKAARMCHDWRTYFACCVEEQTLPDSTVNGDTRGGPVLDAVVIQRSIAEEVANELSQHTPSVYGVEKRDALYGAARILLDYCQDVEGAIDMLISGQLWNEARRLSLLYFNSELEQRILDASEAFADSCIRDFEERATVFETANQRYAEVLKVRESKQAASAQEIIEDDRGSIYSSASMMSAASLQSNLSRSSVGSVTSLSSVISAGNVSTFSLSSHTDVNKHKSKYNQIGKDRAGGKKRKERKQKNKIKRDSEEELNSIISTMEQNCVFEDYLLCISEAVSFLSRTGKFSAARELYEKYEDMRIRIEKSQENRISNCALESKERQANAIKNGVHEEEVIRIGCEKRVDELRCCKLPQDLQHLFDFFVQ